MAREAQVSPLGRGHRSADVCYAGVDVPWPPRGRREVGHHCPRRPCGSATFFALSVSGPDGGPLGRAVFAGRAGFAEFWSALYLPVRRPRRHGPCLVCLVLGTRCLLAERHLTRRLTRRLPVDVGVILVATVCRRFLAVNCRSRGAASPCWFALRRLQLASGRLAYRTRVGSVNLLFRDVPRPPRPWRTRLSTLFAPLRRASDDPRVAPRAINLCLEPALRRVPWTCAASRALNLRRVPSTCPRAVNLRRAPW